MTERELLSERLSSSDSVASLRAEQEVIAAFKRLRFWTAKHSPYFRDGTTGKLRELDVIAERHWSTGTGPEGVNVRLDVLVEVKSLRGYHLIFAPEPNGYDDARAQQHWIGTSKERLATFLIESKVDHALAAYISKRLNELAFPEDQSCVHDFVVHPPKASIMAAAFRETNIGAEKELDNSVLWKAIQGLGSAIDSLRARSEQVFFENLKSDIDFAQVEGLDIQAAVERQIAREVRHLEIFHPVIVIDARLWVSRDTGLEEVEQARIGVQEFGRWPAKWFDVVTRQSFGKWVDQFTSHYSAKLEHPDEAVWHENFQSLSALMEILMNPSLEIDLKVREADSDEPPRQILVKQKPNPPRKGATPVDPSRG